MIRLEARWNIDTTLERAITSTAALTPAVPALWLLDIDKPFASLWHKKAIQPERLDDVTFVPAEKSAHIISSLMIARREEAGPYLPDEIETLSALSPYFCYATSIADLLDYKPLARHCSAAKFDPMRVGIILTDGGGRILHTNVAGAKLLDGGAMLCIEDELSARDGESNAALRAAIAKASGAQSSHVSEASTPILIKGPCARSLVVWVARIGDEIRLPVSVPHCAKIAVFIRPFEKIDGPTAKTLISA